MAPLLGFPHLTRNEFELLCAAFIVSEAERSRLGHGYGADGWRMKRHGGAVYLELLANNITAKREDGALYETAEDGEEGGDAELVEEEDDPEALPARMHREFKMRYNVLFSPTYRLPVLYWVADEALSVEELKAVFSPKEGVISQGEHLLNGEAWWFVHPCNTGEAMDAVVELVVGNEERYISVWLGLVKNAAGLR